MKTAIKVVLGVERSPGKSTAEKITIQGERREITVLAPGSPLIPQKGKEPCSGIFIR